jgi:hypothetical protein
MTADLPELAYTLELDPALAPNAALQEAVERPLAELMATLGVPGRAAVSVETARGQPADSFLSLTVDGRRCSYPEELLWRIHEYVRGHRLPPDEAKAGPLLARLTDQAAAVVAEDGTLAAFLGLACVEIVKLQPAVLLGPRQAQAYSLALAAPGGGSGRRQEPWPPDPNWLMPFLRGLLDLRISIADQFTVAEVLCSAGENRQNVEEELIAALRPEVLELELPTAYLRKLTEAVETAEPGTFASVRDRVFTDLGIVPPPFRLAPAEHLKPRTFACKVNHLSTAPMLGLVPGERVQVAGGETVGPLGYMATAVETAVRAHAPCLVNRRTVQTQLDLLGQAFPDLVDVASALLPSELITGTLRALAREGRSTRNLRQILERLLDSRHAPLRASEPSSPASNEATVGPGPTSTRRGAPGNGD